MYYINYINYTSLFRTYSDILVTLSECSLIYCIVILIGADWWVLILWVNCMTRVVRGFGAPPLLRWGAKVPSTSIISKNVKTDSKSTGLADKLWLVHIHILKVGVCRWGNTQSKYSDFNSDGIVPQLRFAFGESWMRSIFYSHDCKVTQSYAPTNIEKTTTSCELKCANEINLIWIIFCFLLNSWWALHL